MAQYVIKCFNSPINKENKRFRLEEESGFPSALLISCERLPTAARLGTADPPRVTAERLCQGKGLQNSLSAPKTAAPKNPPPPAPVTDTDVSSGAAFAASPSPVSPLFLLKQRHSRPGSFPALRCLHRRARTGSCARVPSCPSGSSIKLQTFCQRYFFFPSSFSSC